MVYDAADTELTHTCYPATVVRRLSTEGTGNERFCLEHTSSSEMSGPAVKLSVFETSKRGLPYGGDCLDFGNVGNIMPL